MDEVGMRLALAAAKASGDKEAVQMIMSAGRDGALHAALAEEGSGNEVASSVEASRASKTLSVEALLQGVRISAEGPEGEREVGDEERAHVASMLQRMLGGVIDSLDPQEIEQGELTMADLMERLGGQSGSGVVVIDGNTGEILGGGEGVSPEVLAVIRSMHPSSEDIEDDSGSDGEDVSDEEGGDEGGDEEGGAGPYQGAKH